jgi:hypothetical protein
MRLTNTREERRAALCHKEQEPLSSGLPYSRFIVSALIVFVEIFQLHISSELLETLQVLPGSGSWKLFMHSLF